MRSTPRNGADPSASIVPTPEILKDANSVVPLKAWMVAVNGSAGVGLGEYWAKGTSEIFSPAPKTGLPKEIVIVGLSPFCQFHSMVCPGVKFPCTQYENTPGAHCGHTVKELTPV